MVEPLVLDQV